MTKSLSQAYCDGEAGAFFRDHYADAAARRRSVERARRPLDPAVAAAIEQQNARFAPSEARARHLRLLREGAAAVVTGQQVGLFLGPLYNFYKAATAIRAAGEMSAQSGAPVVPVFWLQTEDHDLVEIAASHVPRADGQALELALPASAEDRVSLAHLRLPAQVEPLLESLRAELQNLPHAADHLASLAVHYRPGVRWCDAFGAALAEIFAPQGLVLVDPRVPELAPIAADLHRRAISEAGPLATPLLSRAEEIRSTGREPMVHVRDGAPLSFFHPEGPAGPRYRLEPDGRGWREVGGDRSHSSDAIFAALDEEPLSCSTSVLLRPILQDTLLPTAAYVGGAGEVAYFAQLGPLYDALEIPMPMIIPRASFRLVETKTQRLLDRLGIGAGDAALGEDEILTMATAGRLASKADELRRALLDPFELGLRDHSQELGRAGAGMTSAVAKAQRSVEHSVSRLLSKYESGLRHRHQDLVDAAAQVKSFLYPRGGPQERTFGLSYFAARYGERELIERILAAVEPFAPTTVDLPCAAAG